MKLLFMIISVLLFVHFYSIHWDSNKPRRDLHTARQRHTLHAVQKATRIQTGRTALRGLWSATKKAGR